MKKMKMSIMRWLGVQDRMLQLELEISDLQSKLVNFESELEGFGRDLDDKVAHWDLDDAVDSAIQDIDISKTITAIVIDIPIIFFLEFINHQTKIFSSLYINSWNTFGKNQTKFIQKILLSFLLPYLYFLK